MAPVSDLSELATSVAAQVLAAQTTVLKEPAGLHVALNVAEEPYPVLQVTVVFSPVVPVMAPVSDLSELATSVAAHVLASHAVLALLRVYPVLQVATT